MLPSATKSIPQNIESQIMCTSLQLVSAKYITNNSVISQHVKSVRRITVT